ncbi:MAG: TIGR02996 domain-containing protein, partial [Gemmataceae bacterium]|nr:TIGR02996 domain-containing protein [Gemmataceae bacterium]
MSDRAALLKAILDDPDDDTARLVFADWLDEHGEGRRAAYIRAQVAWAAAQRNDAPAADVADWVQF